MKTKRRVQTYKDFLKRPTVQVERTEKKPGDLELVYGDFIRHA
jgi:hypothetical protein